MTIPFLSLCLVARGEHRESEKAMERTLAKNDDRHQSVLSRSLALFLLVRRLVV